MTLAEVFETIREIRAADHDPEAQRSMRDWLYRQVLETIAAGTAEDPQALAREALKVREIMFRW